MKQQRYSVYCDLNESADVVYAKRNCKAGQGGCCKHVAAVLYTILDYSNLQLKQVTNDTTCTQVLQTWGVPSSTQLKKAKAVKFEDIIFENADYERDTERKRKRPIVKGKRENYCATPQKEMLRRRKLRNIMNY